MNTEEIYGPRMRRAKLFERERSLSIVRISKMDESELNRHLKSISERAIPNLTSDLSGSIRAKIGSAAAIRDNWLDRLVSTLLRPQWAMAVLAITLLVSGNLGRILANSENDRIQRPL